MEFIQTCYACGQDFTIQDFTGWTGEIALECPWCGAAVEQSQALVPAQTWDTSTSLIRASDIAMDDLRVLMNRASQPVEERPRTFMEWLMQVDVIDQQLRQKSVATEQVRAMAEQRTEAIQQLRAMVLAARELDDIETEAQRKQLAAEVERLRLMAERLRLGEEIEQRTALKQRRLATLHLQEGQRQMVLRAALRPPPMVEVKDPESEAVEQERAQRRTRALGAQSLIKDFLAQVKLVMKADADDAERALRLRVTLEAYGMEAEDLPPKARKFLQSVEEEDRG